MFNQLLISYRKLFILTIKKCLMSFKTANSVLYPTKSPNKYRDLNSKHLLEK